MTNPIKKPDTLVDSIARWVGIITLMCLGALIVCGAIRAGVWLITGN